MVDKSAGRDKYIQRVIDGDLDEIFDQLPAVLLDGPKGVGKTETAKQRTKSIRRLDIDSERYVLEADPDLLSTDPKPLLIDEYHRLPAVWDAVKRHVDNDGKGGQFLLTGSELTSGSHSGAGRITTLRMRPMTLVERGVGVPTVSLARLLDDSGCDVSGRSNVRLESYVDEIVRGGFPGMRNLEGRALDLQLDGYIERIVSRDLPEAGYNVRQPSIVRSWLRAYAAATSTTASWEKIRDAASGGFADKPSRKSTRAYTDVLTSLRILDPIDPWIQSNSSFARLGMAPKHHLCDPALAARLLQRTKAHLLAGNEGEIAIPRDGTLLGGLFESLAALSIRTFAQAADAQTYHFRMEGGRREIDFIVEHVGRVLALEVKLSGAVDDDDVRHLVWFKQQMGNDLVNAVVLTTGPEAYRRKDGIAVVPLALLGP